MSFGITFIILKLNAFTARTTGSVIAAGITIRPFSFFTATCRDVAILPKGTPEIPVARLRFTAAVYADLFSRFTIEIFKATWLAGLTGHITVGFWKRTIAGLKTAPLWFTVSVCFTNKAFRAGVLV